MFNIILSFIKNVRQLFQSGRDMVCQVWNFDPHSFMGLVLFEFLQGLMPLAGAWLTKMVFDLLTKGTQMEINQIPSLLIVLFLGLALVNVFQYVFQSACTYFSSELSRQLTVATQISVNEKINSIIGLSTFEDPKFYNIIQQATRGAITGPQQSISIISVFFRSVTVLISFNGILFSFDPFLTGLVWLATIPQLYNQIKFGYQRFTLNIMNSQKERRVAYYNEILSSLEYAKDIRLFGLSNYFLKAFKETYQDILRVQRKQQIFELRWQLFSDFFVSLINVATFAAVVLRAMFGIIGLGSVTLYINAVNSLQSALTGIIFSISSLNENALSFSKYKELLALPQPLLITTTPQSIPKSPMEIEIQNVSFRYDPQSPWILRNINLSIPIGQSLALVGLNGAGKTTLVKLITRLYDPVEGRILWGGVDIREYNPEEWRNHIAVILQDFPRYELTVFENIALGNLEKIEDLDASIQAAKNIGIHDKIKKLPLGYQTILSHSFAEQTPGTNLSGGEWQKIALARMFIRQANLLILDEPTASLDVQSEYNLHEQFLKLMKKKTCILISHRFSTVRMSDKIAVLKEGNIVEQGTHEELIDLGGTYSYLYNLQAKNYH